MKGTARCVLLLLVIGVLSELTRADGKFFYAERVPVGIPYQRAFILFHEGSQTLVLQSKYELSQSAAVDSLGWVVPVPSVPEIDSVDAVVARKFFSHASRRAQPNLFRISTIFLSMGVLFFLSGIVLLLLCFVEYPFKSKIGLSEVTWRRRLTTAAVVTLVGFVFTFIGAPTMGIAGDIEVIKAKKVGIYDVKVIRSQNAEAILGWLRENGFGFDDSDVHVFEDYVNRKWCFVVAKVEPDTKTEERKIVAEGMVAPLILKFETDTAVYPLALTSTIGADTEVLLYTLSERKLSCGERLILRCAKSIKPANFISNPLYGTESEINALFADIPQSMILCKFKKKLKPEEMKQDIEFGFAPDNDLYVETKIVW